MNKNGKANRDNCCTYCYAKYLYKKDPNAYRVKDIDENEFKKIAEKYPAHILRLGKNVECGHTRTRSQLYQVLELSGKYHMRPVVTSKILEYDKKVADLVIAARGVVHISLGCDKDEPGAVKQGATNEWRLRQAMKYKTHGCPTQVRIAADITMPMNQFHKKVFKCMGGSSGILLTPLHYISKESFESVRKDITWDEAKTTGLFTYTHGDLRPNIVHNDWNKTRERCGMIAGKECCNNCVGKIDFKKKPYKAELIRLGWNTESAK